MPEIKQKKIIIGLCGGIGSGKSSIAGYFAELGALVLDSDAMGKQVLNSPEVCEFIRKQWGEAMLDEAGRVNRQAMADRVFSDPDARAKLEAEIHPRVAAMRARVMQEAQDDPTVKALVIDSALLFETQLNEQCDVIVYVEVPLEKRVARVMSTRGWTREELIRREKSQLPLDMKRDSSDYVVINSGEKADARRMVCDIFSQINPA